MCGKDKKCGGHSKCHKCETDKKYSWGDIFENFYVDCKKPSPELVEKVNNHNKKCNSCYKPKSCGCSKPKPSNECKKKECDLNLKIVGQKVENKHEAISYITKQEAILIPSTTGSDNPPAPFVYDFDCRNKVSDLSLESNCISYYRLTDATDVDEDSYFWVLSVKCVKPNKPKCNCNHHEEEPEPCPSNSCISLIKVHYDQCKKKLKFVVKYDVPETCGNTCSNYEGLVQVSEDEFLLFADGGNVRSDDGVLFVTIKNHVAYSYGVKLKVHGELLDTCDYDKLRISTAFRTKDGVIFVPQVLENNDENNKVFKIDNCQLKKLSKDAECHKKCLSVDVCTLHVCLCVESSCDSLVDKYLIYDGVEALTANNCGRLFGTSTWVYPFYILRNSNTQAPEGFDPKYVKIVDCIPNDYDVELYGYYTKPVVGKLVNH